MNVEYFGSSIAYNDLFTLFGLVYIHYTKVDQQFYIITLERLRFSRPRKFVYRFIVLTSWMPRILAFSTNLYKKRKIILYCILSSWISCIHVYFIAYETRIDAVVLMNISFCSCLSIRQNEKKTFLHSACLQPGDNRIQEVNRVLPWTL
jgi:hypothetical protein